MITIQSVLFAALGFLTATLVALLLAPAFWSRAVRLTTRRIKEQLPVTEAEVVAEKDRLRAKHALRVHQLEQEVEKSRLTGARQLIEINRRDARVTELATSLDALKQAFDENANARRVLEQTVADRLPRVEQRLAEAKRLLFNRDKEISELTRTAEIQTRALAEAGAINAQHQAEIERLVSALAARGGANPGAGGDPRFDGEVALRSEIEALRAKTRDQSQLISRLQTRFASGMVGPAAAAPGLSSDGAPIAIEGRGARLTGPGGPTEISPARAAELEVELRTVKARFEDQAGEIARLRAAIAVFESGETSAVDSKIALRAKLGSVEALAGQQADTIQKLRAELAAANERLARQAAHFMNELRRLGAGTMPASGASKRNVAQRLSLAERVAQTRSSPPPSAAPLVVAVAAVAPATVAPEPPPTPIETPPRSDVPTPRVDAPARASASRGRLVERITRMEKAADQS